jgi:hypothetical protein
MNARTHAKRKPVFTFTKLGLLICLAAAITTAGRAYGQSLGCNNPPPNTTPILTQLPANFDQRPRLDTSGNIVDAHDGLLVQFGDTFYLYGTAYGLSDGWRGNVNNFAEPTNHYRCYTSTDLTNWTLAADYLLKKRVNGVLVDPPAGLYFLPKVIYNATNNEYVMWYNWWDRGFGNATYLGVARSCSPTGPFEIYNHQVVAGSHDMSILVDDDQKAYMVYTKFPQFTSYVRQLDANYLSPIGPDPGTQVGVFGEGCVMFKNSSTSTYYVLLGQGTCAFCPQGASSHVYKSSNPLSGYTFVGDINPISSGYSHNIQGQQVHVAKVLTTQGDHYLWMADLWGTGPKWWEPLPPSATGWGDRGEDQQYWADLVFTTNGGIQTLGPYVRKLTLENKSSDTWYENPQVIAYPSDGTTPITLGYKSTTWYPGDRWEISLDPLTIGKYYTLELQDIHDEVAYTIPSQNFIYTAGDESASLPKTTGVPGGSMSGYVYRQSEGGYFGWFTAWDGKPYTSTATMTLTNLGPYDSSDPLRVVAYLNNTGPAMVVGWRTDNWTPGQTWTFSLSALTAGACYTFEVQDPAWSNALIPPRSGLLRVPVSGDGPSGAMYNDGVNGYWGWHIAWSGQACGSPATLTLVNDSYYDSTDPLNLVAYLNNTGSPILVGSRTGDWLPQRSWEVSLSGLTTGAEYTFEIQDPAYGNAVIGPRSTKLVIPAYGAAPRSYMYWDGWDGYWGWHTQWGWYKWQ